MEIIMRDLLQYTRPQSMYDSEVHDYIREILTSGENFASEPDKLIEDFKNKFHNWLISSKLNRIEGFEDGEDDEDDENDEENLKDLMNRM